MYYVCLMLYDGRNKIAFPSGKCGSMRNACRVSALETIGCAECEYTNRQDTAKQRRFVAKSRLLKKVSKRIIKGARTLCSDCIYIHFVQI